MAVGVLNGDMVQGLLFEILYTGKEFPSTPAALRIIARNLLIIYTPGSIFELQRRADEGPPRNRKGLPYIVETYLLP